MRFLLIFQRGHINYQAFCIQLMTAQGIEGQSRWFHFFLSVSITRPHTHRLTCTLTYNTPTHTHTHTHSFRSAPYRPYCLLWLIMHRLAPGFIFLLVLFCFLAFSLAHLLRANFRHCHLPVRVGVSACVCVVVHMWEEEDFSSS